MPGAYESVRNNSFKLKKKELGRPLTDGEKSLIRTTTAKWWASANSNPNNDLLEDNASDKSLEELRGLILSEGFWSNMIGEGEVWGRLTDETRSYDAVDDIMTKIKADILYLRIKQLDSSNFTRFSIAEIDDHIKAVMGYEDEESDR